MTSSNGAKSIGAEFRKILKSFNIQQGQQNHTLHKKKGKME
jgi:hypothetical protein